MIRSFFSLDSWQEIFIHLKKHRLRTVLTCFGVFWGIFLIILLFGVGHGLEQGTYDSFGRLSSNSFVIWGSRTTIPYEGFRPGRYIQLNNSDTVAIGTQVEGVKYVCPQLRLGNSLTASYKTNSGNFPLLGVVPEYYEVQYVDLLRGRYINPRDVDEMRKVVFLGKQTALRLFNNVDEAIGSFIDISGIFFKVVGVFSVESTGGNQNMEEEIHVPFSTVQNYGMQNRVGSYLIEVKEGYDADQVLNEVKTLLQARHFVSPQDTRAVGSWSSAAFFTTFQGLFSGIRTFLWVVGIGTLLAGIVGVGNIMIITVKERTKEIGIRKALGAPPFSIITMIIQESIIVTGISGYLGLVFGVFILEGISFAMDSFGVQAEYFAKPEADLGIAFSAAIILILAGTLAGLFPALRAAKIRPVEALKEE